MRHRRDALLRPGVPEDLPALVPLSGSPDRALARLRASAAGDETLLVAQHGGSVVGAVSVRWEGACDPPHPWLYALQVGPDARRHGWGALLVRAAETIAALDGADALSLVADRAEEGVVAYDERHGYRRVRPHQHHWRSVDPTTGEVTADGVADIWVMRRRFGTPVGAGVARPDARSGPGSWWS